MEKNDVGVFVKVDFVFYLIIVKVVYNDLLLDMYVNILEEI